MKKSIAKAEFLSSGFIKPLQAIQYSFQNMTYIHINTLGGFLFQQRYFIIYIIY